MKKTKPPNVDDFDLWHEIARSVTPLGKTAKKEHAVRPAAARNELKRQAPADRTAPSLSAPLQAPPLASFDRRSSQRMLRGQVEIDGRIDLHGTGLELARIHLLNFVISRRQKGARLLLVITGKGRSSFSTAMLHGATLYEVPERQGKLRRALPHWLEESVFREHVIGFQSAHPRHGGGGAFYVRLRKFR